VVDGVDGVVDGCSRGSTKTTTTSSKEEKEEEFFNHYNNDLKRHTHTPSGVAGAEFSQRLTAKADQDLLPICIYTIRCHAQHSIVDLPNPCPCALRNASRALDPTHTNFTQPRHPAGRSAWHLGRKTLLTLTLPNPDTLRGAAHGISGARPYSH